MGKNKFKKPNQQLQNNQNIVTNQIEPILQQQNQVIMSGSTLLQQSINLIGISSDAYQEYLCLKKENEELHLRILELSSNEKILNQLMKNKDATIDELKKENEELKNKIKILESDIAMLKNDIDLLKQQNAKLESRVLKMENKELYDKYVIAIQDVNRNEQLEKHVPNLSTTKNLKKLRNSRVSTCHYLNEEDDDSTMIDDKLSFLYDRINKMPVDIKKKFDKQYPNLISDIVGHIPSKKPVTSIGKTNLEDIENWWEQ